MIAANRLLPRQTRMAAAVSGTNASARSVTGIFNDSIFPTTGPSNQSGMARRKTNRKNFKGDFRDVSLVSMTSSLKRSSLERSQPAGTVRPDPARRASSSPAPCGTGRRGLKRGHPRLVQNHRVMTPSGCACLRDSNIRTGRPRRRRPGFVYSGVSRCGTRPHLCRCAAHTRRLGRGRWTASLFR